MSCATPRQMSQRAVWAQNERYAQGNEAYLSSRCMHSRWVQEVEESLRYCGGLLKLQHTSSSEAVLPVQNCRLTAQCDK